MTVTKGQSAQAVFSDFKTPGQKIKFFTSSCFFSVSSRLAYPKSMKLDRPMEETLQK